MSFNRAIAHVLKWEGGEVNDPHDPGGHTKFGISKKAYPNEDIAELTVERARELYRRDYWEKASCAELPEAVALGVMDMAVNAGVRVALRCLQRAVGVADDGAFGELTAKAVAGRDSARVARDLAVERIRYYAALEGWQRYGVAWTKRTIEAAMEAARNAPP